MPTIYKLPYDSHIRYLPLVYMLPLDLLSRCPTLCKLPRSIFAFYESEEGQREFTEWKKQREAEKQEGKTE